MAVNAIGIAQWKGLNDRGPLVECISQNGNFPDWNSTANRRAALHLKVNYEQTISVLIPPYKGESHYLGIAGNAEDVNVVTATVNPQKVTEQTNPLA